MSEVTQTRRAKKVNVIDKPIKVLREDLQKRKKAFEKKGWVFTAVEGKWNATLLKPKALGETKFTTENFDSFNYLLSQVEEFQKSFEQELKEKLITQAAPTDEKRERLKQWFFKNYFYPREIDDAKKSDDPAEHLRKRAVESMRGGSGSGDVSGYHTRSGGKVDFWLKPDKWDVEPTATFTLRELTRELAKTFAEEPETVKAVTTFSDTVIPIDITKITPSPFEPQARRRKHYKQTKLEELASSIEQQGLLHPIIVRPKDGKHEIVVGERRWLAFKLLGLEKINCFVNNYSDAKALEVQMQENLQRQDIDPLDEAFDYKFLLENSKSTIDDLAVKFGKTEKFIQQRLKLTELIPEALREIEEDFLPLGHALAIAKYPSESQQTIVSEQMAYRGDDKAYGAKPLPEFISEIENRIVRLLKNAPFDTENPNLRLDGLICPNCPQRSKFAPLLFADDFDEDDRCLNRKCFEFKTNVDLRQKLDEIAAQMPNPEHKPLEEIRKEVPLVTDKSWADKTPFKKKPLTNQEFFDEPTCVYSELSLITGGERKGQKAYTCQNKSCAVHNPAQILSEVDSREKTRELERRVELLAREKVLAKAIEFFTDYKPIWMYDDLIQKLIVELWIGKGIETQKFITRIIRDWKELPKAINGRGELKDFVASLDKTKQSQLIFLLLCPWNASTDEVKQLAEDYARTDYRIIEAEARLELAPESEKILAQDILTATRGGGVNDLRKPDFDLDAVH